MLKEAKNYLKGYKQTTESAFFHNVHEHGRDIIEKKTFYGTRKKVGTYDCVIIENYGRIIKVYDEPAMGFGRVDVSYWIPANCKQQRRSPGCGNVENGAKSRVCRGYP